MPPARDEFLGPPEVQIAARGRLRQHTDTAALQEGMLPCLVIDELVEHLACGLQRGELPRRYTALQEDQTHHIVWQHGEHERTVLVRSLCRSTTEKPCR